jgi:putative inorganic carbon (HCO3(-)) transporter
VLLLLFMVPVTLWATALPEITVPQVLRLLAGVLLFYAIVNWARSASRLRILVDGALLILLALALIAPFGVEWLNDKLIILPISIFDRLPLLLADAANPNVMAGYLILFMPLAFALPLFAWKDLKSYERILALFVLVFSGVILFLTQSRGAWLGLLIAFAVLVVFRWRPAFVLMLIAALLVVVGIYFTRSQPLIKGLLGGGQLGSFEGRMEVWSRALYMIQDFSFTGVGMGLFKHVTDLLYPLFLFTPGKIDHAHNLFLQVAVDLGLPGLIAWLASLGGVTYLAWVLYRRGANGNDRFLTALGAGLFCTQVALVVHGLLDAVTWGMVRPAPLVWAMWALIAAGGVIYLKAGVVTD